MNALRDATRRALELQRKDLEQSAAKLLTEATRDQRLTAQYRELLSRQTKSDPLQEAEAALKALREARDTEAQRKAADSLEKALKRLREQQKKEKPDAPRP